jgi:hypothetical protein
VREGGEEDGKEVEKKRGINTAPEIRYLKDGNTDRGY